MTMPEAQSAARGGRMADEVVNAKGGCEMVMINSDRFRHYLTAAKDARTAWVATSYALLAVNRYDRVAWAQAQAHNQQALNAYNRKARDVTTVLQLLLEQAECYGAQPALVVPGE